MNRSDLHIAFRRDVRPSDKEIVENVVESTGFFSHAEKEIAVELVQERLTTGDASGYFFIFAEWDQEVVGYACYGPIPATLYSYDIYWLAVRSDFQKRGLGRKLMEMCEAAIHAQGGRRIYADTSGRAQYDPTRRFYAACGYQPAAHLPDYYAPGDAKIIYVKTIE